MDSHPFLETLKKRGIIQGLDRMYNALSEINNPQMSQKGALIGGTNGKGSTSFILYNLLYSHGFRTALYTSPHIREINDRYLSDGKVISDEKLVYYIENLGFLAEKYRLTLFEFETLIAFRYFSDINTDFSVYEVGMGGRLDATNCFDPKIKIITSVSKDHTEYLGNTEESILYEKAGIIKKNNIVITGIDNPRLLTILRGYCHKRNATLLESDKDFYAENVREDEGFEIFDYYYKDLCLKNLKLSLFGRYQVTNCALSLTAFAEIMNIYGHKIFTDKI
ncbi:MAG: Mur ligase family protein, partial [Deltaproteobacteria bacterium]|nr:Mur ligase family protein [Deltaproteobacteria bacterium]